MPFFLAVDAGGTSTRCLLADDRNVLARASTGSIKLMRVSEEEATARLTSLLGEVSAAAGVPLDRIDRTCIGLAGISIASVRTWASSVLSGLVSGELLLLGDEEIALDAAFPSQSGILLIAGTGSHAIGRAADGSLHSAGGWGPVLGDHGGGYWIGLEALRAALRHHEISSAPPLSGIASESPQQQTQGPRHQGLSPNAHLLQEIQSHWKLASLSDLIELGNRRSGATHAAPDFADLAPVVVRCAQNGNSIAAAVLQRAGEELAALVAQVAAKMTVQSTITNASSATHPCLNLAVAGSILTEIPQVRAALIDQLKKLVPGACLTLAPDPIQGALLRARQP